MFSDMYKGGVAAARLDETGMVQNITRCAK